jgi:hypothetical protein
VSTAAAGLAQDVSGGLSVTARVSLWRVLRPSKRFGDTVVIDGTVRTATNNFFVGLLTGDEYRRGRYSL